MLKRGLFFLIFTLISGLSHIAAQDRQALFTPNQGQWQGDFLYKLPLKQGAVFLEDNGYTALLYQHEGQEDLSNHIHPHGSQKHFKALSIKMRWVNSNPSALRVLGADEAEHYENYILGNDPSQWYSHIPVYRELRYQQIYEGIDVRYYSLGDYLKYDLLIAPGAKTNSIAMRYEGQEEMELIEGRLILKHRLGNIEEYIPESYQVIDGEKVLIKCEYRLKDGLVLFKLGRYDKNYPLVIDPVLVFSSFIGGPGTSWGFTATYGKNGEFYGGGVSFDQDYPTTTGVVQDSLDGQVDMGISKFTADGSNLIFSTYIGGKQEDIPHSMVANHRDELFIVGNTGSDNFPITSGAFQDTFASGADIQMPHSGFRFSNGSNLVLLRLSPDGSQLMKSTYFGGNVGDGLNFYINRNYGDYARSEIIMLGNDRVAVSSSSLSPNLPLNRLGTLPNDSSQNAIIMVFNEDLNNLVWGHYFGGSERETGYSVRTDGNSVYMGGSTNSLDLPVHAAAQQDTGGGQFDGYVARFDATSGQFLGATYMGTGAIEQNFIIEVDRLGDVYALGQCAQNFEITPGVYNNSGGRQFIRKYTPGLDSLIWATQVGSGFNKSDLIPTSFMVDRCLNIYLSGWNGRSNIVANNFVNANTTNLPLTADAFQDSTDGSDFYFMILSRNADSLLFGSYFGGTSHEHVDGGTSRFSPEGVVYQAACAGCRTRDGFPTTPNAFSPTKPGTACNYGAIKFDFQITVRSIPDIDFSADVDTVCDQLEVTMSNNSLNANEFFWDFGNGQTSNLAEPTVTFDSLGIYTITLVARDTLCDISDTSTIIINHDQGEQPEASFIADYAGCDKNYEVSFENKSSGADTYTWQFGDGVTSNAFEPVHNYSDTGTYEVQLIAYNSICDKGDTTSISIAFTDSVPEPDILVDYDECKDGVLDIAIVNDRKRYTYDWYLNGLYTDSGRNPTLVVDQPGLVEIRAEINDSLCHNLFSVEQDYLLEIINLPTFIPNVFTPNGDNLNDSFKISGIACGVNTSMQIFNRWGQLVFETDKPFDVFWDGYVGGKAAPDGVYSYVLNNGEGELRGHLTLIH
jgi:gliding motility-associated-like protein